MVLYLLITAGPTGSGKASLIQETFSYLIGRVPSFVTFLVDDLVENDLEYKKEINSIIETFHCTPPFNSGNCNLNRPTEALLGAFKQVYFKIRSQPGCQKNVENLNCNELNDINITHAIEQKQNIVIETTGSYIPAWVLDLENLQDYQIIFSYSVVSFDILLLRNATRATRSMLSYFNDRTKPAPRLIDIRNHVFFPIVDGIAKTLVELRNSCLLEVSSDTKCMARKGSINNASIANLLVFDNSSTHFKNIYDHRNKKDFEKSASQFKDFVLDAFFKPNF